MKQITLKNYRKDETLAISIVLLLSLALIEGLMFPVLLDNWHKPPEWLIDLILMLLYALFICAFLVWIALDSRKWICITEDSVVHMSGKKVIKSIPKEHIIAYGVYSQYEKHIPGFPFFCYATVSEVSEIAQKYWHWRKRIYRKNQLEELEKTPEGMWILQMSVYIYWEHFRLERNQKFVSLIATTMRTSPAKTPTMDNKRDLKFISSRLSFPPTQSQICCILVK